MARLWAEVWTAAGVMQGVVDLASCIITRRLDSAGQISIEVPTSDTNAVNLLQIRRRVRVYTSIPPGKRHLATGVLLQETINHSVAGQSTSWVCTDEMQDFIDGNTMRGLIFNNVTTQSVVNTIADRVGWNVIFDGVSGNYTDRFDGVPCMEALLRVANNTGYHFRIITDGTLRFGALGGDSGLTITQAPYSRMRNGNTAIIERLSIVEDGYEIINWIEPISGPVDGGLTLRKSNQTSPYTITSATGPNGQTLYYLLDQDSIDAYGVVQAVVQPPTLIVPVAATETGMVNAANILYSWASTFLQRHSVPKKSYSVGAVRLDKGVAVGDKVRLRYRGEVWRDYKRVRYADIDADFWVIETTDRYNLQGHNTDLVISNVAEMPANAVDLIAGSVMAADTRSKGVALNVTPRNITGTLTVDSATTDSLTITIADDTVDVPSLLITVTRNGDPGDPEILDMDIDGNPIPGGPWLYASAADTVSVEAWDILELATTLQGDHTLTLSVQGGSGDLSVTARVVEVIIPGVGKPAEAFTGRSITWSDNTKPKDIGLK